MTAVTDVTRCELRAADGRRLTAYVAGPDDAVPLVFHHGTPGAGTPFSGLLHAALDHGLRWLSLSRPGYDGSDRLAGRDVAAVAADVAVALDAVRAESAYVAGWSGGGPHALATAALMPERTVAVATLGGVGPWDAEDLDATAGMGADNLEEFGAAVQGERVLRPFLDAGAAELLALPATGLVDAVGSLLPEPDVAALHGSVGEWWAGGIRAGLAWGVDGWVDDDLAFVRPWGFALDALTSVPVAVWQGEEDLMVPSEHALWLGDHVPHADVHLLARHGHLSLLEDRAGEIVEALVAAGR